MSYFLVKNQQRLPQWSAKRRNGHEVVPQVVLHTYEAPHTRSLLAAATYFLTRDTQASYHTICGDDSAQDIMQLAPVTAETWHCKPSNNWSIGISAIAYAHQWNELTPQVRSNLVKSMAYAAYLASRELMALGKKPVPARWITRDMAMRKEWGFVMHSEMDPGRRSDAGKDFPRAAFMAEYNRLMSGKTDTPKTKTFLEALMADANVYVLFQAHPKGQKEPGEYIANLLDGTYRRFPNKSTKDQWAALATKHGIPWTWHASTDKNNPKWVNEPHIFGREVPWS